MTVVLCLYLVFYYYDLKLFPRCSLLRCHFFQTRSNEGCKRLCLSMFPFQSFTVHANKRHDQGQISNPESSRILMLGFESMHLILTVLLYDVFCSSRRSAIISSVAFFSHWILLFSSDVQKRQKSQERITFVLSCVLIFGM